MSTKISQMKHVLPISVLLFAVGSFALPSERGRLPDITPERKCNWKCTLEYKPLCTGKGASPPRTFDNLCLLNAFNCNLEEEEVLHVVREGECKPADAKVKTSKQCHKCQSYDRPVCAKSNYCTKTFHNLCFMELENCELEYNKKKEFKYQHDGPC